ncbi:ubiquitin-conjugating enzyme E2 J1-like [Tropilaelaps mercedesae]|uniref:Ubiquitin-conjugating enzyme E2 J1-like n=1 Tax=Tropilaelaps mercedesae TaxID=418985 RepID=A0A1V9XGS0_9ACAR|nr:ubiquitin-conjugating enzyme E2 J1-like [Tropilaelaps mercedesae]
MIAMEQYNYRSPAVKRLMKEAQELREATEDYFAQPLDDNLFEWHFTVRGPPDSDFEGGIYHGRIILPSEYPMKPPNIVIMTPNGRFETNKKICLSISGHHPESWQPSWSLRTAILALIGFMPTEGQGAIGSLECSSDERKKLARRSANFSCPHCGNVRHLLKEPSLSGPSAANREAKELAAQVSFTSEAVKSKEPIVEKVSAIAEPVVPQPSSTIVPECLSGGAATTDRVAPSEPTIAIRQRVQPEQHAASTTASARVVNSTQPQTTPRVPVMPPTITLQEGLSTSLDLRMIINFFMVLCAAGFLSLCIRRVCFF